MDIPDRKPKASLQGIPGEIMDIIGTSLDKVGSKGRVDYVLDGVDIGNLRLVNRQVCQLTNDVLRKRFFTSRKHMLSRRSLQALIDISCHPLLSTYVEEVAIGPERINPNLKTKIARQSSKAEAYDKLIAEQVELETGEQAPNMLATALFGFPNLKNIRIDMYLDRRYEESRCRARGMKSILRQLKAEQDDSSISGRLRPDYSVFEGEHIMCASPHGHYAILQALYKMKDREGWTIDFVSRPETLEANKKPFEVGCREWQSVKDRVRSFSLKYVMHDIGGNTADHPGGYSWIAQVLCNCKNVPSLSFEGELNFKDAFSLAPWPDLRHLTLLHCNILDSIFHPFFAKHSGTLETIVCEDVTLTYDNLQDLFDYESVSDSSVDTNSYKFSDDSDLSDPEGLIEYSSWWETFEVMLTMPRLKKIQFSRLSFTNILVHVIDSWKGLSLNASARTRIKEYGRDSVPAEGGEVAAVLERAVQDQARECQHRIGWIRFL